MEWLIPYKLDTDAPDGGRPSLEVPRAPEPVAARHRDTWAHVRALFLPTPTCAPCSRS
ncbi:hypothetical protein [Variovorax sp. CY25R-8]|jgi:hypothetical protein|uniref:hypothetical protein n=1 Tax=Variovorax sp. CY25R-8 TaxID=2855501 RepID=UPI000B15458C|nr:hypothetical protein [Variovorax sp. CY25R-8]MCT8176484.1 hypothetical protein [Variovorax sp. CY25R-8]